MSKKELLGRRIRELRKRKGISQEKLSELVNVDPATISNIECGKNYPSFNNLENILNILDCTFLQVFDFEHKQEKEELLKQIVEMLEKNPDKIEDFYKIVVALVK